MTAARASNRTVLSLRVLGNFISNNLAFRSRSTCQTLSGTRRLAIFGGWTVSTTASRKWPLHWLSWPAKITNLRLTSWRSWLGFPTPSAIGLALPGAPLRSACQSVEARCCRHWPAPVRFLHRHRDRIVRLRATPVLALRAAGASLPSPCRCLLSSWSFLSHAFFSWAPIDGCFHLARLEMSRLADWRRWQADKGRSPLRPLTTTNTKNCILTVHSSLSLNHVVCCYETYN